MAKKGVVLYPEFEKCKDYTLDEYWQELLDGCAKGKMPKNSRYDPNSKTIYTYTKKKSEANVLSPDDPIEMFRTVMNIFRDVLELVSPSETKEVKDSMAVSISLEGVDDWKKVKVKYLKDQMMRNYVQSIRGKYKLSKNETRQFMSFLHLGFQFKNFQASDVHCTDGIIESIDGFEFDLTTRRFVLNNDEIVISTKTEKTKTVSNLAKATKKYFRDYNAKRVLVT